MIETTNHVFGADGARDDRVVRSDDFDDFAGEPLRVPTIADIVSVTDIMSRGVTCATREFRSEELARLLVRSRIGCVPVVDGDGRVVGIVSKLDLVEQLLAMEPPAERRTAGELMMPIALTLGPHATIAQAASLMANHDVHHVPIVNDSGGLVGIVSSLDIVRWLAANDGYGKTARTW